MAIEGKLSGLKAIVTGGTQGIGETIAKTFAREGSSVAVIGRNLENGKRVASEIEQMGGTAMAVQADVTRRDEVTGMVKTVIDRWGTVDILVNNAGGYKGYLAFVDVSEDDWDHTLDLNLKSVFLCSQAVARNMIERRRGRIISIGAIAAMGYPPYSATYPPYVAAKAAVVGLTKHLAKELGPYGITVNAVSPGTTLTPRIEKLHAGRLNKIAEMNPMGRILETRDCAEAVLFLASQEARYITGVNLNVNAGILMA
jgi:3-oxoacyl-[acyl-carrier protein] reductase